MNKNPTVDILMATYNGEKYLQEQLKSIEGQTYTNWNLIIRDDCSKDNTVEILKEFEKAHPGQVRIYVNVKPSGNAKNNFLHLLSDAENNYVMFSDQDDVWLPDKIECTYERMAFLEKTYKQDYPCLVYTDLYVVDKDLNIIANSFIQYMNLPQKLNYKKVIIQNSVSGCTVMINKKLLDISLRIKTADKIIMHDHFLALTASILGKYSLVNKSTIYYRQHGMNSVGASNAKSLNYMLGRYYRGKDKFKSDLKASMKQVEYFLEIYCHIYMEESVKSLLKKYSNLYNKNKIYRLLFYLKNRVLKKGIVRTFMQLVWG